MSLKHSGSQSVRRDAPSAAVLDVFVVWHPNDLDGADVCSTLFEHYHSDSFSGLAGSAVEVYGRSLPMPGGNGNLLPIVTPNGIIGEERFSAQSENAPFCVVLPVVGRNLVQASLDVGSPWARYLESAVRLREMNADKKTQTLILPVLPAVSPDYSNAPIVGRLMGRQGVNQGYIECLRTSSEESFPAAKGELARDLGQAVIQGLLRDSKLSDRLTIFVSHARSDAPREDQFGTMPTGPVAKVEAVAKKTKLATFVDVHDLQAGVDWDSEIRERARRSALLMVRTDAYASREWTQWEVLEAKKADMPIVCLSALSNGEQRGSFLLDHVPTVAFRESDIDKTDARQVYEGDAVIVSALNRLVDETLKRALWFHQDIPFAVECEKEAGFAQGREVGIEAKRMKNSNSIGFDAAPLRLSSPSTSKDSLMTLIFGFCIPILPFFLPNTRSWLTYAFFRGMRENTFICLRLGLSSLPGALTVMENRRSTRPIWLFNVRSAALCSEYPWLGMKTWRPWGCNQAISSSLLRRLHRWCF